MTPVSPRVTLTAQAVADLVGGRLSGDGTTPLSAVRALDRAGPTDLSVCSADRFLPALAASAAGAVLVGPPHAEAAGPAVRIVVDRPMAAAVRVAEQLAGPDRAAAGIHPTAIVGPGARLGAGCEIGPGAVIGGGAVLGAGCRIGALTVVGEHARLGDNVRLDPRVTLYRGVVLGNRVHCKSGAVIGGGGFGYAEDEAGTPRRVPHLGGCILGDDVEVGANSCIDRGSLDDTVIGRGTKLDNLVHVAHNVRIGENCLLMAGVGVSGSTRVGDRVVLAGQAGLVGHITVGDDARVGAQSGVIGSVGAGETVSGFPARNHREYMRAQAALYRLAPRVAALEALLRRFDDA